MVTLSLSGNQIQGRMGLSLGQTPVSPGVAPTLSEADMEAAGNRAFNTVNQGMNTGRSRMEIAGRSILGTGINLADNVWSSPLNPVGWVSSINAPGSVWNLADDADRQFFAENKDMLETTSGITGAVLSIVVGDKFISKLAGAGLAASTAITGTRLYQSAKYMEAGATLRVLQAQKEALAAGEKFSMLGTSAGRQFLAAKAAVNVGIAARQEALIYGVMWNNEAINMEGVADDAFWIGVGLGFGAAGAAVQSRSILRRSANSAEIRNELAGNLTMAGVADTLTRNPDNLNALAKVQVAGRAQEHSVDFTQWAVAARSNSGQGIDTPARIATQENALRAGARKEAELAAEKMLTRGIDGMDFARKPPKETPEVRHLVHEVAKDDPFVLHGAASLAKPTKSIREALSDRASWLVKKKEEAMAMTRGKRVAEGWTLVKRVKKLESQQPMVLLNGAWVAPDSKQVAAAQAFDQAAARSKITRAENGTTVLIQLPFLRSEVVLDGTLTMRRTSRAPSEVNRLKGRKLDYANMHEVDRLYIQEGMRALVAGMSRPDTKTIFRVTKKNESDWLALDMADEILERGGKIEFDPGSKIASREDLQRESIRLKARAVIREVGLTKDITEEVRLRYNLPESTSMERLEDPNGTIMRAWLGAAAGDSGTVLELSQALKKGRAVAGVDLMEVNGGRPLRLSGNFLNWNRDKDGRFLQPMLAMFNPPSQIEALSRRGFDEAFAAKVAEKMAILVDRTKDTFVNRLARNMIQLPQFNAARRVSELNAAQSTGIGGKLSQVVGEFLPRKFLHRDNPMILAASRLHEAASRMADMEFNTLMEKTGLKGFVTLMDTPSKAAMNAQLDEYASLRPGWDIEEVIEAEPGWFFFQLSDTEQNRRLLGKTKIDTGDFLPNLRLGKPVAVQAEALATIKAYNQITNQLIQGTNTVRASRGMHRINPKSWFMPSPDTKGRFVGFTFDPDNKVVPMHTIVANSEAEYEALVKRTIDELPDGHTVRTREQMESTIGVWDKAEVDWINHGHSAATAGIGKQAGGLTGQFVKRGAFMDAILWAQKQTRSQAHETLQTMMAEPLRLAKMRAAAERVASPTSGRSIFDEWEHALTGTSARFRETSILAKGVYEMEAQIDKVLSSAGIHIAASHVLDMAHRFGVSPSAISQKKTYRQILDTMGAKSPFASYSDFLESQGMRMPPTLKAGASKLNAIATNVVLRWDPGMAHAAMNMLGLIPTLTAGVKAGHAPATLEMSVRGRKVGFIDGLRIIQRGIKDLNDPAKRADWEWMVRNGDAHQSTFEYRQTLGAIKSQAGFMKWFGQADKWLSYFSDGSENLSRQISHLVGLRLADAHGIKGMEARHSFAREFANAAIADYNPANRPEFYQTATGSVIGLFQSYVVNQYTKMFHWAEQGEYGAMMTQAAFQASLFGVANTYGIGQLIGFKDLLTGESGEPDMIDQAYRRFGPVLGGALMNGSFGELTQLALWSRGDTNVRLPVGSGQMPAGIDVMTRFARMFTDTVSESIKQGPVDALPAIIENIQREMPNRMLKGLMAVTLLDGKEMDRYGQVMTETRTWADTIARVAGLRSRRMQQELEVFYANKSDIDRDAARRDVVRQRFRTDVRTAERNGGTVDPMAYFDDYVASGGNPRRFRSFVREIMQDATTVRTAQQLKRNLASRQNNLSLWRYGAYGAWGIDDGTEVVK